MNEIITVEQAVKLTSRFDEIAAELNEKKARVEALLVSEESRKDAKEIRAEINKEAKAFAAEFKDVKTLVLKPWNDVEAEYKAKIDAPFKEMDKLLKEKIDFIEDGLKAEKKTELSEYFEEYKLALGLDVEMSEMILSVGLSKSITAYKKEIKEWLDGINSDLKAIGENTELLAEYQRNGRRLSLAIQTIAERKQAIRQAEELRAKRQAEAEAEAQRIAEMEKIAAEQAPKAPEPVEVIAEPEKQFCVGFKVFGTLEQLKALKAYLIENEYKFETV